MPQDRRGEHVQLYDGVLGAPPPQFVKGLPGRVRAESNHVADCCKGAG